MYIPEKQNWLKFFLRHHVGVAVLPISNFYFNSLVDFTVNITALLLTAQLNKTTQFCKTSEFAWKSTDLQFSSGNVKLDRVPTHFIE